MSAIPNQPPSRVDYDALPLTNEETNNSTHLFNAPPSPHLDGTHALESANASDMDLPFDAPRPRFMGHAMYNDNPSIRQSIASSHNTIDHRSEYSSVYALNPDDPQGPSSLSRSYYEGGGYSDIPNDEFDPGDLALEHMATGPRPKYLSEKRDMYGSPRKSRRRVVILSILAALILLIVAVVIPIYFAVIKPKSNNEKLSTGTSSGTSTADPSSKTSSPSVKAAVTGGDGSQVTMDDGTTFTYSNSFGGTWYHDPEDPFNNGARAQSWSPALNETFNYGTDKIRGVNLGGWLTLEPFISPAVFQKYSGAVDEWTLSTLMTQDTANGGLSQLENHYKTFITEQDFAQIAGAGLNFVRIALPYWAIEVRDNEPFLPKTAWTYFLKAIQWARKYGIRINLDFHALPGSQNGWNHSGRLGTINMLNGPMGIANAQRSLDYIRIIAEFISQPQYKDVVVMFGITNEPYGPTIGQGPLQSYYLQAYNLVRAASGTGEGKGPYVSIHDGFFSRSSWANWLPNADRVALDDHPYICFGDQSDAAMSTYANAPCSNWGSVVNTSMGALGLTVAGEWSNAVTDCGLYLNGVGFGTRYEGNYTPGSYPRIGDCTPWTNWQSWDQPTKNAIKQFALSTMDALQNWFFWTWKIGNSSVSGVVETPAWSYQLGLQQGWLPADPREAVGACGNTNPWSPPLQPWQTGGAGAGNIPASALAAYPWPPAISNAPDPSLLPTYTPTGAVPTLPGPSLVVTESTATVTPTVSAGSGWNNAQDTAGAMVPVATCSYLDPWVGPTASPPSPLCGGAARREEEDESTPTAAPKP